MEKDVVHTYSGILHSHLQGWNGAICSNTDTPRDDHTKWSKSEKERQRPHDTAHMRNQKYDTNEPIYDTGLPAGSDSEKSASEAGDLRSIPDREDPLGKETATHSSIPPAWETPRLGNLVGPSPWGRKELDKTEKLWLSEAESQTQGTDWGLPGQGHGGQMEGEAGAGRGEQDG